jgi:6-phosphogluconolactonase
MDMAKPGSIIHIFKDSNEMTAFLVQKWREIADNAIARKGSFTAALSGGTTPGDFYRRLAALKDSLPWDKTHVFLVDERVVPFSNRNSNFGMIDTLLLSKVKIPRENIHAIIINKSSSSNAAVCYEEELKRFFRLTRNELPVFDLISLGIGPDGHTASLFPGTPESQQPDVGEEIRFAVSVEHDNVTYARISLTLPVINNAANVIFVIMGEGKAEIARRIISERDPGLPAARVEPSEGTLLFVLDAEAASLIAKKDTVQR